MVRVALLLLLVAACSESEVGARNSESEVGSRNSESASESESESESASASASESESESESESASESESESASESHCLPVELCGCPLGCTRVTGATVGARVRGEAGSTCGMDHEVLELSTPDGPALVLQPIAPEGARCARQCRARRRGPSACVDRCGGCAQPDRELWYWPPESSG